MPVVLHLHHLHFATLHSSPTSTTGSVNYTTYMHLPLPLAVRIGLELACLYPCLPHTLLQIHNLKSTPMVRPEIASMARQRVDTHLISPSHLHNTSYTFTSTTFRLHYLTSTHGKT
eukprot:6490447-Amphidinium_carterae.4